VRSMKKTSLYFGLVNIPVRFYKATENGDIGFHQHHGPKCMGRIGYVKTCKDCGHVVDHADIVKGIEVDGNVVVVTDDEMSSLAEEAGPEVEVIQFAEADEIDPLAFENGYYLEPDGNQDGYALLREVLRTTERSAIVKFTLRGDKLHLGTLRVKGEYLVIHSMRWPNEVRDPSTLKVDPKVVIKPKELKMAHLLVESMLEPFQPEQFVDAYTGRLEELIETKAAGKKPKPKVVELDDTEDVTDILAALEASVARRQGRAGGNPNHPAGKKRAPAKRTAARKAPARRRGAA
jgi:DNA end-binding protein Ku